MRWRTFFFLAVLALVIVGAIYFYLFEKRREALPQGFVFANGRLESDTITVSTKVSGKLEKIYFREGDTVQAGTLLARLSARELSARSDAAMAAIKEAQARYQEALMLFENAGAVLAKREKDLARFKRLYQKQLIAKNRLEEAELLFEQAKNQKEALRARLKAIKQEIARLKAQRQEIEATLQDTLIKAPASGTIVRKVANLGEVLSPGSVIALMVDLDKLYLKAYIPEDKIGLVALGQEAHIYVDAFPKRFFTGKVGYIAKQAEFTPKEVQTREARVTQVYAVKIFLEENPGHVLTPGLPADALIKVDAHAPWPEHF